MKTKSTIVGGFNEWGYITQEAFEELPLNEAIEFGEVLGIELVTDVSYKEYKGAVK